MEADGAGLVELGCPIRPVGDVEGVAAPHDDGAGMLNCMAAINSTLAAPVGGDGGAESRGVPGDHAGHDGLLRVLKVISAQPMAERLRQRGRDGVRLLELLHRVGEIRALPGRVVGRGRRPASRRGCCARFMSRSHWRARSIVCMAKAPKGRSIRADVGPACGILSFEVT